MLSLLVENREIFGLSLADPEEQKMTKTSTQNYVDTND